MLKIIIKKVVQSDSEVSDDGSEDDTDDEWYRR